MGYLFLREKPKRKRKGYKSIARTIYEQHFTLSTFIYYYIRPAVTKMADSDDWENQLDSDEEADKKEDDKKKKFDDEDVVDAEALKKQKAEQAKKRIARE